MGIDTGIKTERDTSHKCYITCPHCGNVDFYSWDSGLSEDGETITDECGFCKGKFIIEFHVKTSTSYSTTKLEE